MKKEITDQTDPDSTIEFNYQSKLWDNKIDEDKIRQIVDKALSLGYGPYESYELSVVFADNEFIQQLNKQFRNKDKPTNVLSFPQYDDFEDIKSEMGHLGDIVLAYETIENESAQQSINFQDHLAHLIAHGVLHLLGYDHIEDDEAELMQQKEIEILHEFAIENPYKDEA